MIGRRASYYACVLSIKHLFRPAAERHLAEQADWQKPCEPRFDEPAPKLCYLWTLTFPDKGTRQDAKLAMKRWDSIRKWYHKTGKQCVRVLERGDKGEKAFHFHCVTPQWWDVVHLRTVAARYGFGRVQVEPIPIERALYVAKYVGKQAGADWLPRGMRMWASVGFEGASQKNLRQRETVRVIYREEPRQKLYDVLQWWTDEGCAFTHRYRQPHEGADVIHKMELKPAQSKEIVSRLVGGALCAVAEFRGAQVRTQTMEDFKTKQSVERVLVECTVEIGGMANVVTEWTKPGTKQAEVKLPTLHKGEPVLVLIETVKWYKGSKAISGTVQPLPALV